MDPIDYFRLRYYERWLDGITQLLIDKGYLSEEELASRTKELMANDAPSPGDASSAINEQIVRYLRNGDSPRRDSGHPRFAPGDRVRISNVPAAAHTSARLGCPRPRLSLVKSCPHKLLSRRGRR
jgi:nitrile hydratase